MTKPKKILQIDVDHLSDEELDEIAGGRMGAAPRLFAAASGEVGCACVCIGDDAESTASTTTKDVHAARNA